MSCSGKRAEMRVVSRRLAAVWPDRLGCGSRLPGDQPLGCEQQALGRTSNSAHGSCGSAEPPVARQGIHSGCRFEQTRRHRPASPSRRAGGGTCRDCYARPPQCRDAIVQVPSRLLGPAGARDFPAIKTRARLRAPEGLALDHLQSAPRHRLFTLNGVGGRLGFRVSPSMPDGAGDQGAIC